MNKGFTIVELLVSISILALILVFSVAGFGVYNEKRKLQVDSENLASKIGELRAMAVAGEDFGGPDAPEAYCFETEGTGYYRLYADMDGDSQFGGLDLSVEKVFLSSNIAFNESLSFCFVPQLLIDNVCLPGLGCAFGDHVFSLKAMKTSDLQLFTLNTRTGVLNE